MSTIDASDENVFLFIPNVIGYVRIVLATCSLYFMPLHPRRCSFLYAVSCLLDALDGFAARHFKQSTRFGAVLDMITDRCTTTCLLVFLAIANPAYAPIFQGLISLDFTSHYVHMYATLAVGETGRSHKDVSARSSRLLNFYYKKWVLFVSCALNETFFIGLYLLCFSSSSVSTTLLDAGTASHASPYTPLAPSLHPSPFSAAAMETARANKLNDRIPWWLTMISMPVMLFKQWINVVQLINASQRLADADRQSRRRAQIEKTQ